MSVGLLLITHPGVGSSLLHSATRILSGNSLNPRCLEVPIDAELHRIREQASIMIREMDQGDGILILTDLYGATPNNVARELAMSDKVAVLAGLNLPMLVRAFNYPDLGLAELCTLVAEGGVRGITSCTP